MLRDAVEKNIALSFSRVNPAQRKVHDLMKKFRFYFKQGLNFLSGQSERMLFVAVDSIPLIYPRMSEREAIIKHFYSTYKGEGARKLVQRIKKVYAGITRDAIQQFLNRDVDHTRLNPVFKNKPALQPVESNTVNSRHQKALVSFEKKTQIVDGKIYK